MAAAEELKEFEPKVILTQLNKDQKHNKDQENSFIFKAHSWICWSWKYLWGIWFFLIVFLFWFLRGPLKLKESINMGMFYFTLSFNTYFLLFFLCNISHILSKLLLKIFPFSIYMCHR